jgi:acetyl-CoA carboxylase biotin carboxylase subunit
MLFIWGKEIAPCNVVTKKFWKKPPSPALNDEERFNIGKLTAKAVAKLGYLGLGTVEYLYQDGEFYFIEMNTRLQVEHPVTEMITGIDLVHEQIRVAAGAHLPFKQSDIKFKGHAIECRLNAENPKTFMPSPGTITDYHVPGGLGIRVDSALYTGYKIPPYYDSLASKLIVHHAQSRNECIMRLRGALDECVIGGIDTTLPLHKKITKAQSFLNGDYDVHWLERFIGLDQ